MSPREALTTPEIKRAMAGGSPDQSDGMGLTPLRTDGMGLTPLRTNLKDDMDRLTMVSEVEIEQEQEQEQSLLPAPHTINGNPITPSVSTPMQYATCDVDGDRLVLAQY